MNRASTWIGLLALAVGMAVVTLAALAEDEAVGQASPATDEQAARAFVRVPAPDGIEIRRFNKTEGAKPTRQDRVTVHYHGTFKKSGEVFDSSRERGRPATFPLNGVVPCWQEAVTRLRVGEKAEVTCPAATAYGARGAPPRIPPNSDLVFEIELIGIQ
jgi:FKBP-type peptidyl-prolyl cis-trans isomerase FkpA